MGTSPGQDPVPPREKPGWLLRASESSSFCRISRGSWNKIKICYRFGLFDLIHSVTHFSIVSASNIAVWSTVSMFMPADGLLCSRQSIEKIGHIVRVLQWFRNIFARLRVVTHWLSLNHFPEKWCRQRTFVYLIYIVIQFYYPTTFVGDEKVVCFRLNPPA